jgi:hypothetical protein
MEKSVQEKFDTVQWVFDTLWVDKKKVDRRGIEPQTY